MIGFQPYETFQLLVETGGVDRANTLLVAACDAFAHRRKPPQSEIDQFEALATRLFRTAGDDARSQAAKALSDADALSPTLQKLVTDHLGEGLSGFLSTSRTLSDETLAEIVEAGDVDLCAAIAARHDLNAPVLTKLFQMNSRRIYRALAANQSIVPRGAFQSAFARSAQMDHEIARLLANRADFDTAMLAPAFFDLPETERLMLIHAFEGRKTPEAPIRKTIEQISVATKDLTRALMKLFTENRRPEVTRLLGQITGLDEVRCGQIAHDTSGAALFVVLRAFSCTAYDGLKVLIHATSHDKDRSQALSEFAKLFQDISPHSMAYLLSAWRGEVDLLDLNKPEYRRSTEPSRRVAAGARTTMISDPAIARTVAAIKQTGIRQAS
jgi:CRP-like cAMP-binding protein